MFSIQIEGRFLAGHFVRLPDGELEPPHRHDWRVQVELGADRLDENGFVVDFHQAQRWLEQIARPLNEAGLLNELPGFKNCYPTAEQVAIYIYEKYRTLIPATVSILAVMVEETPGCQASYRPK